MRLGEVPSGLSLPKASAAVMQQLQMPGEGSTCMCSHFIHLFALDHQQLPFTFSAAEAENAAKAMGKSDRAYPPGIPGHCTRTQTVRAGRRSRDASRGAARS